MEEKWHDVDWVGIIKKNDDEEQRKVVQHENLDDYDIRHKIGCKVCVVKSKLSLMEM